MRRMYGIIAVSAIFLALVMLMSNMAVSEALIPGENSTYVLIGTDNIDDIESLSQYGEVMETYDSFLLMKVSQHGASMMQSAGLEVRTMGQRGLVGIKGHSFDVQNGIPQIPQELSINGYEGEGVYILQFIGPIKPEWKTEIQSMGVTFYNYLPRYNYVIRTDSQRVSEIEALTYVSWVGVYQPAYKISPGLEDITSATPIVISTYPDASMAYVESTLTSTDIPVGDIYTNEIGGVIHSMVSTSDEIRKIAFIAEVRSINAGKTGNFIVNDNSTWIQQSNVTNQRTVTAHGVTGRGIVVTEMDSELSLDHEMFYDPNNNVGPNHRKILDRYVLGGGAIGGGNYHGQHVAGTIAGDAPETVGGTDWYTYNKYDGHAHEAKIIFQDIDDTNDGQGAISPPSNLADGFNPSYNAGSRIHTNSWGGGSGYTDDALEIDTFIFDHQDYTILFAMGNSGSSANTLSEQPEAKNAISVGAIQNAPNQNDMASFSSRGYADDGRIKPTICGVGDPVTSADQTDDTPDSGDETSYYDMSGTSMATPGIAGQAAQVRQYFEDGYYPSGSANSADAANPSSALVKAILVNGAVEISGSGAYENDNRYPNGDQGWGRSHLDNGLYFSGDARKLKVFDNTTVPKCLTPARFTASGQFFEYNIWVEDSTQELEFTLVWADYPGADNADPAIVNDLDLIVTHSGGDFYWGNMYTGTNPGRSITNPTSASSYSRWDTDGDGHDDINVVESVLLVPGYNTINTGKYTVRVEARNIANTGTLEYQPFALVVTGGLDITPPTFAGIESVTDDGTGTSLTLSWSSASDTATPVTYNIYRSTTPGGQDFSTPTYCNVTETTFQDTGLTEGTMYYYVVRAVDNAYNEDSNTVEMSGTPTSGPATMTVNFVSGWNMISIPWLTTATDINTALSGLSWDRAIVYQNGQWYTYNTARLAKFNLGFPNMDNTMGIWVHTTATGNLTEDEPTVTSTDIPLSVGWNLIGYPSNTVDTVSNVMAGFTGTYDLVQTYDASAATMNTLAGTDNMEYGNAYWIHVTTAGTLTVNW